jgi:hypothetical protein
MDVFETFPKDRIDTLHDDLNRIMRLVNVGHQSTLIEAIMLCDTVNFDRRKREAQEGLTLLSTVEQEADKLYYSVEAVKKCKDGTIVALACVKKSTVLAPEPFVTWCWGPNAGFYWGHYFRTERNAEADFKQRCEKYDA